MGNTLGEAVAESLVSLFLQPLATVSAVSAAAAAAWSLLFG